MRETPREVQTFEWLSLAQDEAEAKRQGEYRVPLPARRKSSPPKLRPKTCARVEPLGSITRYVSRSSGSHSSRQMARRAAWSLFLSSAKRPARRYSPMRPRPRDRRGGLHPHPWRQLRPPHRQVEGPIARALRAQTETAAHALTFVTDEMHSFHPRTWRSGKWVVRRYGQTAGPPSSPDRRGAARDPSGALGSNRRDDATAT